MDVEINKPVTIRLAYLIRRSEVIAAFIFVTLTA